jgi:hypothetical protein
MRCLSESLTAGEPVPRHRSKRPTLRSPRARTQAIPITLCPSHDVLNTMVCNGRFVSDADERGSAALPLSCRVACRCCGLHLTAARILRNVPDLTSANQKRHRILLLVIEVGRIIFKRSAYLSAAVGVPDCEVPTRPSAWRTSAQPGPPRRNVQGMVRVLGRCCVSVMLLKSQQAPSGSLLPGLRHADCDERVTEADAKKLFARALVQQPCLECTWTLMTQVLGTWTLSRLLQSHGAAQHGATYTQRDV